MVIGGSQIYDLFLPHAGRLYLTRVHAEVEGDAFFPAISEQDWRLVDEEHHAADERNQHAFSFQRFERVAATA